MSIFATASRPAASRAATSDHSVRRRTYRVRLRAHRHPTPKAICLFWQLSESGHRSYWPSLGRWVNRDPIAEAGGINIYAGVGNNGICDTDTLRAAWLRAIDRGRDFYQGYLLYGYRSTRDPTLERRAWHGGTARLIMNDECKPEIVHANKRVPSAGVRGAMFRA
jgi:hypothetical protein